MKYHYALSLTALSFFSASALAVEYPVGHPILKNGMEIQGVYLQPITMDTEEGHHAMNHLAADKADIHLEADIHATEDNPNGFAEGDWIPYLTIEYTVTKSDAPAKKQQGTFMAMVANDGPHYGENLKLDGNGQYNVTYKIYPPSYNKDIAFGRHIDKETGVSPWFEPFEVSWDFTYSGTGRKGSY